MNDQRHQPAILALRVLGDRFEALEADPAPRPSLVPSTARGRIALAIACAVPACVAVAIVVTRGSTPDSGPPQPAIAPPIPPSQAGSASEVYVYDDLAQMQATSDSVVRGTVVAIRPGRTVGGPDEPEGPAAAQEYTIEPTGAIQFNEVVLHVDEWLGGTSTIEAGSEIILEEEAPHAALAPSSQVGDTGVYFVMEKTGIVRASTGSAEAPVASY